MASVSRSMISSCKAGFSCDATDEFCPVAGQPAGFRRNQPMPFDLVPLQLVGTHTQRLNGAVHGRFAQGACCAKPLAQPHDARERI